ncbi:MAG: hypothetical protein R3F31_19625 [Verrucomicrobiales bacterium]
MNASPTRRSRPTGGTPSSSPRPSATAISPWCAFPGPRQAVRDLCRARTDASDDLSRAKQRLNSFLLRNGFHYSGKARWTPSHLNYLRHLTLPDPVQNLVLEEYLQAIDAGYERVERLATRMKAVLADWEWEPVVRP